MIMGLKKWELRYFENFSNIYKFININYKNGQTIIHERFDIISI